MARDEVEKSIIKKALAYFNEEVSDEELENESAEPSSTQNVNPFLVTSVSNKHSVYNANLFLNQAFVKVLNEFKWTYFTERLHLAEIVNNKYKVEEEIFEKTTANYGFSYTFKILDDIYRLTDVFVSRAQKRPVYEKHRDIIATNYHDIEVYGIVKKELSEYEEIPSEFWGAVALYLAYLIQPMIAPQNPLLNNTLIQQYALVLQQLERQDCQDNFRREIDERLEDV